MNKVILSLVLISFLYSQDFNNGYYDIFNRKNSILRPRQIGQENTLSNTVREINVVSCKNILKKDSVSDFKILANIYKDLKQNPDSWVCAYRNCDYYKEKGWFAIKKDKSMVFVWYKEENETVNFVGVVDKGEFFFTRTRIDKYDIKHFDAWEKEEAYKMRDFVVELFTSDVKCSR